MHGIFTLRERNIAKTPSVIKSSIRFGDIKNASRGLLVYASASVVVPVFELERFLRVLCRRVEVDQSIVSTCTVGRRCLHSNRGRAQGVFYVATFD